MTRSSTNSGTTILVILIIVFTFPIWIAIAGGLFGLVAGLFGAAIGIVGAVFGAIIGVFGAIIGGIFGDWHVPFGCNTLIAIALVFAIVMLARSRDRKR